MSSFYKIPIYPVNHAIGHIELGKLLTGANDPLVLLVSGGHTMLLSFLNKQWRVFGETLDITLGQLLDQFGRSIGFASPCGKNIEELASTSTNYVSLPYSVKEMMYHFQDYYLLQNRFLKKVKLMLVFLFKKQHLQ